MPDNRTLHNPLPGSLGLVTACRHFCALIADHLSIFLSVQCRLFHTKNILCCTRLFWHNLQTCTCLVPDTTLRPVFYPPTCWLFCTFPRRLKGILRCLTIWTTILNRPIFLPAVLIFSVIELFKNLDTRNLKTEWNYYSGDSHYSVQVGNSNIRTPPVTVAALWWQEHEVRTHFQHSGCATEMQSPWKTFFRGGFFFISSSR